MEKKFSLNEVTSNDQDNSFDVDVSDEVKYTDLSMRIEESKDESNLLI